MPGFLANACEETFRSDGDGGFVRVIFVNTCSQACCVYAPLRILWKVINGCACEFSIREAIFGSHISQEAVQALHVVEPLCDVHGCFALVGKNVLFDFLSAVGVERPIIFLQVNPSLHRILHILNEVDLLTRDGAGYFRKCSVVCSHPWCGIFDLLVSLFNIARDFKFMSLPFSIIGLHSVGGTERWNARWYGFRAFNIFPQVPALELEV